jgi:DNA mismatch repair protein MutL
MRHPAETPRAEERPVGRIRVLDDLTVNRIAAGEVVERPASVVKELVENSLDAGATRIDIEVQAGGRSRIRVSDDGTGMDRDDALLALERHATSKLGSPQDLLEIRTLGFRGEALPSIAAVSRFTLRTAVADGSGTEIEIRGGKIKAVREVGAPRGTSVEVADLFFGLPARRKFLRSEASELAHVLRWVARLALARPEVRFRLTHGSRVLIDAPPARDAAERAHHLYGRPLAQRLLPFSLQRAGVRVHGLAGRPAESLPRGEAQHLFVNGRAVQDRVLSHAVRQAYGDTMPKDRYPAVVAFLDLDPSAVDVNVHPQKTEVRFARSSEVHDAVRDAVASALGLEAAVPSLTDLRPGGEVASQLGSVAASALHYLESADPRSASAPGVATRHGVPYGRGDRPPSPGAQPVAVAEVPGRPFSPWTALVQYRESYIVAQDDQGLVLVDQHAAHERVLFEHLLHQAENDRAPVQRLLFPVTVELGHDESALLSEEIGEFRRLGFALEPFGEAVFRVDGVPAVLGEIDPATCLRELLGEAREARSATVGVGGLRRKLVTSAACQAAIKIHHPLTHAGMTGLLDDLARTSSPTTCPHGRPVLFRIRLEEIERGFRRR